MSASTGVTYRSIDGLGDAPRLQALHAALFPVAYPASFYKSLALDVGAPYHVLVAVVPLREYSAAVSPIVAAAELADDDDDDDDAAAAAAAAAAEGPVTGKLNADERDLRIAAAHLYLAAMRSDDVAVDTAALRSRPGRKHYGSARAKEVIIGFVVWRVRHVDRAAGLRSQPVGYISTFGVHAAFRCLGIGRALLDRAIYEMKCLGPPQRRNPNPPLLTWMREVVGLSAQPPRIEQACLHVWAANSSAMAFYARYGFVKSRFLQNYYAFEGATHDAFLLELRLGCDPADDSACAWKKKTDDDSGSVTPATHGTAAVGICWWQCLLISTGLVHVAELIAGTRPPEEIGNHSGRGDADSHMSSEEMGDRSRWLSGLVSFVTGVLLAAAVVGVLALLLVGAFKFARYVAPPPPLPQ